MDDLLQTKRISILKEDAYMNHVMLQSNKPELLLQFIKKMKFINS